MKQLFLSLGIFLLLTTIISAQNVIITSTSSTVPGINENLLLENLIGIADYHGTTPIELRVILSQGKKEKIRGLDNRTVTTADLNIQAFDFLTEQHLDSKDFVITASGNSEHHSNKELLQKLRSKKSKITTWLTSLDKGEIDCGAIKNRIQSLLKINSFSEAYTLANNQACQENAYDLKESIITAYQNYSCSKNLRKAKAELAVKNYEEAIKYIITIDPDTACGENIDELIQVIQEEYQEDYTDSFNYYLKYMEIEVANRNDRKLLFDIILLNNLLDD